MKKLRDIQGKSQTQMAASTGLAQTYISKIENGHIKHPKIETISKIAEFFAMYVSDFIRVAEEESRSNG